MIEDRPIDTDQEIPKVLSREEARKVLDLSLHMSPEDAQRAWDEIVAPLYDARRAAQDWYKGQCRRCFAHHPALANPRRFGAPSRRMEHSMYCPKYVGPLEHEVAKIEPSWAGDRILCSCGQTYPYWADEDATIRGTCPDNALEWRGPRPGENPSEESPMTDKKNESQQADQQVQDEQSVLEQQRLANLKASGQIQEGEEPPAAPGEGQREDESK